MPLGCVFRVLLRSDTSIDRSALWLGVYHLEDRNPYARHRQYLERHRTEQRATLELVFSLRSYENIDLGQRNIAVSAFRVIRGFFRETPS